MQVQCKDCGWTGDATDAVNKEEMSENKHGVGTRIAEQVCPECGGELVDANPDE